MWYKKKSIKFFSDGSSYFHFTKNRSSNFVKNINRIDYIKYSNFLNSKLKKKTEAKKVFKCFHKT